MNRRGIIVGLLCITVGISMITLVHAEYEWTNHITIYNNGMQWQYTENISGMDSYVFKYNIDKGQGNKDDFVSAWELLKMDKHLRNKFRTSIEQKMDVKIDNSSYGIAILDIDASLSDRALGPDEALTNFTNTYQVRYGFEEGLFINGSTLWLLGEPDSELSVKFPEGTQIISTSGIDNVSIYQWELSGRFAKDTNQTQSPEGAEITYHINQTLMESPIGSTIEGSKDTYPVAQVNDNVSTVPAPAPTFPVPFITAASTLFVIAVALMLSKD
ncbi:MAG: hypothetical protein MIO93_07370 [ANME-2 cluster archaeon]|jgi:hypothetical protein|nr:hypothetical protein [ANME-2 cluster archaeon]